MKSLLRGTIAACALTFCVGQASAAIYSFNLGVGGSTVDGFFEVDSSDPNYVGGGTTSQTALLDYAFTFTSGPNVLVGTPANLVGIQNFNITYAPDLSVVTFWDIAIGFDMSPGTFQFNGTNIGGGYAQIFGGPFFDFVLDPMLSAVLQPDLQATPIPGALPLFATGLGAMGLLGWRRRKRTAQAAA